MSWSDPLGTLIYARSDTKEAEVNHGWGNRIP